MRIQDTLVHYIVDWVLDHPEIDGFSIAMPTDRLPYKLVIRLNLGKRSWLCELNMDLVLMGHYAPKAILREALETQWSDIKHDLRNQSNYKESKYT